MHLARSCAQLGIPLIHFSTDFVFDGEKGAKYIETDAPNPLNEYGKAKLRADLGIIESGCSALIFRISWVYGFNGKNFLHSLLAKAQKMKKSRLRVINLPIQYQLNLRHMQR